MIGEPLVSDRRLARVEREIRKQYPNLPEGCEFVTFHQPPVVATPDGGIARPIAAAAVFAIHAPNPRHPKHPRLFARTDWYESFHAKDVEARHSADPVADPVYRIYMKRLQPPIGDGRTLPEQVIDWDKNLREMN